eukprot:scaffold53544_cov31-Prasinocladus_malaysianus.AAC.1
MKSLKIEKAPIAAWDSVTYAVTHDTPEAEEEQAADGLAIDCLGLAVEPLQHQPDEGDEGQQEGPEGHRAHVAGDGGGQCPGQRGPAGAGSAPGTAIPVKVGHRARHHHRRATCDELS